MRTLPLAAILSEVPGRWVVPAAGDCTGVSTDSRAAGAGCLFFALRGENFDGHDYIDSVVGQGAAGVVVDEAWHAGHAEFDRLPVFVVQDTRHALGDAAAAYLARHRVPVVAVTGSSGKTTTRRMIVTLLEGKMRVHSPVKNFNNEIGVPHTIFGLEPEHELLVLEMGMNHAGELHRLAEIARPDIAVVTNIGSAHIEHFGSREGIANAKKEIFDFFTPDCAAVLNGSDPFAEHLAAGVPGEKIMFYPVPEGIRILEDLGAYGYRLETDKGQVLLFSLGGEHNMADLAAAVAVAKKLGLPESVTWERIPLIRGVDARTQIVEGRFTILNDSYNANPDSMRAALCLLRKAGNRRRVAVLGDMFELGTASAELHRDLGGWLAAEAPPELVVLAGPAMAACRDGLLAAGFPQAALCWFPDTNAAALAVAELVREGDFILVKGSRGMRLEKLVEALAAAAG